MTNKYPRIEGLGLAYHQWPSREIQGHWVLADDLERILSEGVKVHAHYKTDKPRYWGPSENGQFDDTHTGLVIGIKPIPHPKTVEVTEAMIDEMLEEWINGSLNEPRFSIWLKQKLFGEVSK